MCVCVLVIYWLTTYGLYVRYSIWQGIPGKAGTPARLPPFWLGRRWSSFFLGSDVAYAMACVVCHIATILTALRWCTIAISIVFLIHSTICGCCFNSCGCNLTLSEVRSRSLGAGLGLFGPQAGPKSIPNDPDRTPDNLKLQSHELKPHP